MFTTALACVVVSCTNSKLRSMSATDETRSSDVVKGYAPVNGLKMYYEIHQPIDDTGKRKPPVVLIHGGGSTIQTSFGKILPLLAQHYKVIAVELQAHGHTSDRSSAESFNQDADDVAALLAYLEINKASFLGFSNGGHTAMQIGISHPELVNKLVIVSAFYKRDGSVNGFFEGLKNANLGNMPAPLKEGYLKINNDSAGLQAMFDKDVNRMLQFKDWGDQALRSIQAPTFIIAGDHDVVTPEHAVKMSQLIPNAQLMILPGTHGSFIGEVCTATEGSKIPGATVAIIQEFLDK